MGTGHVVGAGAALEVELLRYGRSCPLKMGIGMGM